jgi:hypothetical protein
MALAAAWWALGRTGFLGVSCDYFWQERLRCFWLAALSWNNNNMLGLMGGPVDNAQERSMLAQCKGEAALATAIVQSGDDLFHQKEATAVNACMARNDYIRPQ